MNETTQIIILAIVQGVAEFLPISSSGHLVILNSLFGLSDESVQITVVLHAGTLVAILAYYWREIIALLKIDSWPLIGKIIVATIPAGVIGVGLKLGGLDDSLFAHPVIAGFGLLITACLLAFLTPSPEREKEENAASKASSSDLISGLSYMKSFLIGLSQALAVTPGVSRSGSTIATALKCGVNKEDAAKFSFFLAIPAIGGATFLEFLSALRKSELKADHLLDFNLALGFVISAIVGYFSLKGLISILKKGKLSWFAAYCATLGIIVIIWQLAK